MQIERPAAAQVTVSVLFTKRSLSDKLGEVAPKNQDTCTLQANALPLSDKLEVAPENADTRNLQANGRPFSDKLEVAPESQDTRTLQANAGPLSDKLGELAPKIQDTSTLQANANQTVGNNKAHSKYCSLYQKGPCPIK